MSLDWTRWLGRIPLRRERVAHYSAVRPIPSRDELPADLGSDIFIVERNGKPLWAVLSCPCKCGDRIDVNLMRSRRPYWRLRKYKGAVSLYPSLWVSSDKCGSHFFLVRNTVRWVPSWPSRYTL